MYHSFHSLQNVLAGLGASVNALQAQQAQVLRELKDTETSVASFIGSQQSPVQHQQLSEEVVHKIVSGEVERAVIVSEDATRTLLTEQVSTILLEVDRKIAAILLEVDRKFAAILLEVDRKFALAALAPLVAPPTETPDSLSASEPDTFDEVVRDVVVDADADGSAAVVVDEITTKGRKGTGGRGRGKKLTI